MPAGDPPPVVDIDAASCISAGAQQRWRTPTGAPCPRSRRLDGGIEGTGDCHACGLCLLVGGLID